MPDSKIFYEAMEKKFVSWAQTVEYDTWHAGRFLCEWANKETQVELQESFGHFDRNDSWKALMATITLFKRVSHEVAEKMKFSYPYDLEKCVEEWMGNNWNRRE